MRAAELPACLVPWLLRAATAATALLPTPLLPLPLQVPQPVLQQPTDAIVRVTACAICGSDLHPYHGR